MTLAPGGSIVASEINTEQDANRSTLQTFIGDLGKSWTFNKRAYDLSDSVDIAERSMDIIPSDDWELLAFGLTINGQNSGVTITATLETPDDIDNTFLLGSTLTRQIPSTGSALQTSRVALTTTSGQRVWLLRGVKYRFSVSSTDTSPPTGSWAEVNVACKSKARER